METKPVQLPEKLSDLLLLALADIEKVERDHQRFTVSMEAWFRVNHRCAVCMAGAVMACTLGVTRADVNVYDHSIAPWELNNPADARTGSKLQAIDDARVGSILTALERLDIIESSFDAPPQWKWLHFYELPDYVRSGPGRKQWEEELLSLIGILQAEGL